MLQSGWQAQDRARTCHLIPIYIGGRITVSMNMDDAVRRPSMSAATWHGRRR